MRTALVTVAHRRHEHLALQHRAVGRLLEPPDVRVVVAVDDDWIAGEWAASTGVDVVAMPGTPEGLPLTTARNAGVRRAVDHGAELLVLLDVDCLPATDLVTRYRQAAVDHPGALLCGPVTYLPPPPPGGYDLDGLPDRIDPHPARPVPADGCVVVDDRHDLFWSLSFAVTADTWRRCGGFDEAYVGYGAEDTDLGRRARAAGVPMAWVGGAHAWHQHHPGSSPPVEHVASIVRNARLFHERWGEWPMGGWLDELEMLGHVVRTARGWELAPDRDSRVGA